MCMIAKYHRIPPHWQQQKQKQQVNLLMSSVFSRWQLFQSVEW